MSNLTGQVIRGYEFLKPIGSGGYGMVYEAVEKAVDRRVAIKIILPEHANQPEFIANFENEAKLVAQLEHLNIVPLYTYWRDENGAFLVMRYIRGGSLREMLAKHGALSLSQTTRILAQVADALHAAHEAGVVHRDLKPENILLDERGNAYLTDFGIAKRADGNQSATDAIKGTFAYLSPEQIQQTNISPQTDIYAFGIMLYEMLAGKHPFQDTPIAMMVMKHLQESLPALRDTRPELPEQIDEIIERATAKDPLERHQNILEVATALKNTVGETAIPIPKPIGTSPPKTRIPASPEQRNRYAMLQNVRTFWIEGVLDNSLHNAVMIDLGMRLESGAVDNLWNTVLRTPHGETTLAPDTPMSDIFDRMNGKLLILGDPGGGKTTTLLELAQDLLARAEMDAAHPIPVVFNLSSWAEKKAPLTEWLIEELSGRYHVPRKIAAQWVENDELLLLLDGLDEVPVSQRDACVQTINAYRAEHGFVDMVVCSRIKDYEALTYHLQLNGAVVIQPLAAPQIERYLAAFGADARIVNDLIRHDEQLRELAQSPLMLSIMVMTYRGVSAESIPDFDDVEKQRQHLFGVYVQRMFARRPGEPLYTEQETIHYLAWLAKRMQQHGQSLFNIEDLQPTWLADAHQIHTFPNRVRFITTVLMGLCFMVTGLAWYLAVGNATPLMIVAYALTGMIYGYLFAHNFVLGNNWYTHNLAGVLIGGLIGISFGIGVASIQGIATGILFAFLYASAMGITAVPYHLRWVKRFRTSTTTIVPLERVQYSLQSIQWGRVLTGVFFQTLGGFIFSYAFFPNQVVLDVPRAIGVMLLGLIPVAGFNLYMDGFTATDVQMRLRPNEGMYSTVQNIISFTLVTVFIIGAFPAGMALLGVNIVSAFFVWLAFSMQHGSDTVLSHGGIPLVQHLYLRYQLQRKNAIPANLARFLDYAASLILLRKVGGGYIFVHRYLLEYFAGLDA